VSATQQNSLVNVKIGRRTGLSGFSFNGTIDEPRIYRRALTRAEIQTDMATAVGGGSPPPDTTPPGVPTGLGATAASASQINLAWAAASDNVGVTGYLVERCQGAGCGTFVQIATTTTTGFGDTGLIAGTSCSYRVRAADAAGNLGAYSSISSATTTQASDATAPSVPTGLGATAVGSTQINLAWTASTDNVGVTDYRVERCKGAGCSTFVQIATATTTSFNNTGLRRGTSFSYRVCAADAAGNLSAYSSVASATTSKRSPQEGGGAFLRTTFRESLPAFSRDGRWLAYSSDESGPDEALATEVARHRSFLKTLDAGSIPVASTMKGNSPLLQNRDGCFVFPASSATCLDDNSTPDQGAYFYLVRSATPNPPGSWGQHSDRTERSGGCLP